MEKTSKSILKGINKKILCVIVVLLLSLQIIPSHYRLMAKANQPIESINATAYNNQVYNYNSKLTVQSVETSSTMDTRHSNTIINGMLEGETSNPKIWVSNVVGTDTTTGLPTDKELTIILDLGEKKSIAKYVIYHANANNVGMAPFNTAKYEVFTSDDKTAWTSINKVEDNTADYNEAVLAQAVECRYFKVKINQPEQKIDSKNYFNRARISEIELYSASNGRSDLLDIVCPYYGNKPLTYDSNVTIKASSYLQASNITYVTKDKTVVNGIFDADPNFWISNFMGDATHQGDPKPSITFNLGAPKQVEKYVLYHAGVTGKKELNTKEYKVYAGNDENALTEIEYVKGNSKDITMNILPTPITAQFIKIEYLKPDQEEGWDDRARLVEFEAYSSTSDATKLHPNFIQNNGASVRLNKDLANSGIRFEGRIFKNKWDVFSSKYSDAEVGFIIVPTDYIAKEFTEEALNAANKKMVKINCTDKLIYMNDGTYRISAALIQVLEKNYNRDFSAIMYMESKSNKQKIYSAYDSVHNSRNISYVATKALGDADATYTEEQETILNSYIK